MGRRDIEVLKRMAEENAKLRGKKNFTEKPKEESGAEQTASLEKQKESAVEPTEPEDLIKKKAEAAAKAKAAALAKQKRMSEEEESAPGDLAKKKAEAAAKAKAAALAKQKRMSEEGESTPDDLAKKKAAAAAKAKAAALAKQKRMSEEGDSTSDDLVKKKAAAAAKARAAALAKQKRMSEEEESAPDDLAKKKAAAAAKAKAAALAKQKRTSEEGASAPDDLAKKKAAAAAKAKAAALAKQKRMSEEGTTASDDLAKKKAAAAAKAKAAALAKQKRDAGVLADSDKENTAEPTEEATRSPNQLMLDFYTAIIRTEMGNDSLEDAYINKLSKDVPTLVVKRETYFQVLTCLRNHRQLQFNYLSEIHGTDFLDHFEVYLYLQSLSFKRDAVVKVKIDRTQPEIESVTPLWPGANWAESEAYDLLGIHFIGHPDLKRILLGEEWQGHPLRKDYVQYDDVEV